MAVYTLLTGEHLACKATIHKHAEVELWLCRWVVTQRVVPDGKARHIHGVVGGVEEAYLVHRGLILHITIRILKGVDAIVYRLKVLCDEDTILLGTSDNMWLILEHRRVPLLGLLHAVGNEEVDERLTYAIGLIRVCRISRHVHRINLRTCREYVAHRVQRVRLVIILNRRAKVDSIGGIGA